MARSKELFFFLSFLLCFATFTDTEARVQKVWCILKRGIPDPQVQQFLDFACSQIDCSPINTGGQCYAPNTYANHGSYALNLFYRARDECRTDIGYFEDSDPSYGNCHYP